MIAGGARYERSAYLLNLQFNEYDPAKITQVKYSSLAKIPFKFNDGFYESVEGRPIIGSGVYSHEVAELDGNDWINDLPLTKIQRNGAAAIYHSDSKSLIVSGGLNPDQNAIRNLGSIEILQIDPNGTGSAWKSPFRNGLVNPNTNTTYY